MHSLLLLMLLAIALSISSVSCAREVISYKVIQKTDNYEERHYDFDKRLGIIAGKYGVEDYESVRKYANKKITDYIHGKNEGHQNVAVALPILEGFQYSRSSYMQVVLGTRSTTSLPQPSDKDIDLGSNYPKEYFYANTLNGSPTYLEIRQAAYFLHKALTQDKKPFLRGGFIAARYSESLASEKVDILVRML